MTLCDNDDLYDPLYRKGLANHNASYSFYKEQDSPL